ncbi:MAG: glycosyltransferase [Armatimonadetes bacterium]|nr:glycosyltransferase [Armatimonadota bacterium]
MPLFDLLRENATPLLAYQIFVSVFAFYSLVNAATDWFAFRRPVAVAGGERLPSVSVLIPARNEEPVIAACVASLQAQDYPGTLEIIVLDDRSDDDTGLIVAALAATDSRVRLLSGGELLPGWKGKPNALRQMAAAATGDILLLTDADCVFYPGAVAGAAALRETMNADVLSLMPHLSCGSFWEHVIVPLQYVLVFATLPIRNVWASKNPAFAAANGAFILVSAKTYSDLGGHEPVKAEMAEDIRFAQHTKRQGRKLVYADGSTTYSVRMYHGLRETWDGFSKNVFSAMGNSVAVVAVWSGFLLLTQVFPFAFLAAALASGDRSTAGFWLPLCHVAIAIGIRAALTYRFRQAWWAVLTHPVGWLLVITIAWNSAYLAISGRGHSWKGRTYTSAETPR